jgi:fumarate reductase flavoprotein subunit
MPKFDVDVDVLVIGSGGAGLAAAVAAHESGANVAVVEKLDRPGGNTALSTGSVPGAGTRFQKQAGIDDSPQKMLADLNRLSGPHDASDLTCLLVYRSAELVEWLADVMAVRLDIISDYKHVAHSVPRLHAPASRKGQDLVDDMVAALDRRGIPMALANPVSQLVVDDAGKVIGAVTQTQQGNRSLIGASKIVLAVNGFGAAPDMVAKYCPEIAGAMYVGARGSQGEAVRWGLELNAQLGNMASYQGFATVIYPHGELLSWTTIEKGGIVVNAAGQRFGDESIGYSGYTAPVMAQEGPVHAIFDQRIHDIAQREPWFKELLDYGGAKQAADIHVLAQAIGVDATILQATLADYNASAQGQHSDRHGRTDFGIAPLKEPFWFTRVLPALLSTQGGLMIDAECRVLDARERPVPNLFAAGGAVAGISGLRGGVGYASGSGLLHAIGLGFIAGQAAAREAR